MFLVYKVKTAIFFKWNPMCLKWPYLRDL